MPSLTPWPSLCAVLEATDKKPSLANVNTYISIHLADCEKERMRKQQAQAVLDLRRERRELIVSISALQRRHQKNGRLLILSALFNTVLLVASALMYYLLYISSTPCDMPTEKPIQPDNRNGARQRDARRRQHERSASPSLEPPSLRAPPQLWLSAVLITLVVLLCSACWWFRSDGAMAYITDARAVDDDGDHGGLGDGDNESRSEARGEARTWRRAFRSGRVVSGLSMAPVRAGAADFVRSGLCELDGALPTPSPPKKTAPNIQKTPHGSQVGRPWPPTWI
jgi:hypothetical protein